MGKQFAPYVVEGKLHRLRDVKEGVTLFRISMLKSAQRSGVVRVVSTRLPTVFGVFDLIGFERGNVGKGKLRVPSLLGLAICSIEYRYYAFIRSASPEGRRAYGKIKSLQNEGLDTIEANQALGFDADCCDFSLAVAILHDLKVRRVRLLSNNPQKREALRKGGIDVIEQIACERTPSPTRCRTYEPRKKRWDIRSRLCERAAPCGALPPVDAVIAPEVSAS